MANSKMQYEKSSHSSGAIVVEYIRSHSSSTSECVADSYAVGYIFHGSCTLKQGENLRPIPEGCAYLLECGRHLMEHNTDCNGIFEQVVIHFDAKDVLPECGESKPEDARFERAVLRGLAENISIEDLARECYLSASTFKRRFRRRYSMAPHRWFLEHRLDIARRMISTTELMLSEVATLCGFTNMSHFTSSFRRHFGITPSRLRRQSRATSTNGTVECDK